MSSTLNANQILFVIPCKSIGDYRFYNVVINITYQVIFHGNFNHP